MRASGRATAVLDRFPFHLGLADPGKRFGEVVGHLSDGLDLLARQVRDVQQSHRLGEAPTDLDLLRLAGLHGTGAAAMALVDLRLAGLASADSSDTAVLSTFTGIPAAVLDTVDAADLASSLADALRFDGRLGARRRVVAGVIGAHRIGNGTTTSILHATAAYLGLRAIEVEHSPDRWWHVATCRDGLSPVVDGHHPVDDLLALEENPFTDASVAAVERRHGDRFRVLRGGLEEVTVTTDVVGLADRTVAPMVVNLDDGAGVFYEGVVADGATLTFAASGQVTVDGTEVTGSAFAFTGGLFASVEEVHGNDFVFGDLDDPSMGADRVATFVVTTPVADAFGPSAPLPHGGAAVAPLRMALGETRFAFFVRVAHFGPGDRAAVPGFAAGVHDRSVFAAAAGPLDPSARVGFRWEEREPFAARVLVPMRLSAVDDADGTRLRQPLRALLDDHRPAGVHLAVAYADPRWDMGTGITRDPDSTEALGTVLSGTTLWPDGTPQPSAT